MRDAEPVVADQLDPSLDALTGGAFRQRVRLDLAYEGTDFFGWAVQPGLRTVQSEVQQALAIALRVPAVALTVAGRTDTGVHATGQVAHFDTHEGVDPKLLARLAGILPGDVRVLAIRPVPTEFDARFGALWRRYEYRISDHPAGATPLRRRFVFDYRHPLDEALMAEAATRLLGLRDFVAFCKWREIGTTVRTVQVFDVRRVDGEIVVTIQADAFCHSMVRSLVGSLIAVGQRRQAVDWPERLLSATSRSNRVTVAPGRGLTLVEVGYPPDSELAARTEITRARRG